MRYSNIETWANYLNEHEVAITRSAIKERVKKAGIKGVTGRARNGSIYPESFFSESDIREACSDLLRPMPIADSEGFIEFEEGRYGTCSAWSRKCEHSEVTIKKYLNKKGCRPVEGKIKGEVCHFYSELDFQEALSDLLSIPRADVQGFVQIKGERYACLNVWSKKLGIHTNTIRTKLKKAQVEGVYAISGGMRTLVFREIDVTNACSDSLDDKLPEADVFGFFIKGDKKYGTIEAFTRTIGIKNHGLISNLIDENGLVAIEGKTRDGRVRRFYVETAVKTVCAHLTENIFQSSEEGFFEHRGEKYGLPVAWSRILPFSRNQIRIRLTKAGKEGLRGRRARGRVYKFYSLSDVKEVCGNMESYKEMPTVDKNGLIEQDGIEYGTKPALSKLLGISYKTIGTRLRKGKVDSIKGKTVLGRVREFHAVCQVAVLCEDVLGNLFQANKSGFFEKEGECFGTIESWSRKLPISAPAIKDRLSKKLVSPLTAKTKSGMAANFYSESDIRSACADLLNPKAA